MTKYSPPLVANAESMPRFHDADLLAFDGADPTKPVYLGLDGYVYDVSSGRKFYGPEGPYHFLAGKDSSASLHIFGANLIQKKYPVIGVLVK